MHNPGANVFTQQNVLRLPAESPPQLMVVIDTEEEFDWSAEPDRNAVGVSAMGQINRVQDIFDHYAIVPCYVIDYPVASQEDGFAPLRDIHADGRCEIGAHLHPWVNPPFDESLSRSNMYPGNLDRDLELAKLRNLRDAIEENFGFRPTIYKAGRYGLGANTAGILQELGFDIDLSFCPPVDYREDGGPDYSDTVAEPHWFGADENILEIPVTGAFVGWAGRASKSLYNLAGQLRAFKAPGILSRLSAVDRLMLSPEGFDSRDHIKVTRSLYRQGVRTFTWSFHSPSVVPGFTPYVNNTDELEAFLNTFRTYFDFFFNELGGVASTPTRIREQMEAVK